MIDQRFPRCALATLVVTATAGIWFSAESASASVPPSGAVTVDSWGAIPGLLGSGADAIILSPSIGTPPATVSLAVPAGRSLWIGGSDPDVPLTIEAPATGRTLVFTSGGGGAAVEIANLRLTGKNPVTDDYVSGTVSGGGITASGFSTGKVALSGLVVEGVASNAVSVSNVAALEVTDSTFRSNYGANGGAIQVSPTAAGAKIHISDSSFVGNGNRATNYYGGALYVSGGAQNEIVLERSVFLKNMSGGRGGALMFQNTQGSLAVRQSHFEENTNNIAEAGNSGTRSDGGAIGIEVSSAPGLRVLVEQSTFVGNSSYDEGGAIIVEGFSRGTATTLRNSTFIGNVAAGRQTSVDGYDGGGAGEFTDGNVTVDSCTFVGNVAARGTGFLGQRGGALSADFTSSNVSSKMTFRNTLIVGNEAAESTGAYQNVFAAAGINDLGGNIGIDNGTALPSGVTAAAVYGTSTPAVGANGSSITAGDPRWTQDGVDGRYRTVPTVMILPGDPDHADGPTGLADNTGTAADATEFDQRGSARQSVPDVGAVEIAWLRFDANGGSWTPGGAVFSDRAWVPEGETIAAVYEVGSPGENVREFNLGLPDPVRDGYVFAGWAEAAAEIDGVFEDGGQVRLANQTLFAIWRLDEPEPTPTDEPTTPQPTEEPTAPTPTGEPTVSPSQVPSPTSSPTGSGGGLPVTGAGLWPGLVGLTLLATGLAVATGARRTRGRHASQ